MISIDDRALDRAVGAKIRLLRNEAGLNQDDLASRLGVLRTSITNIELGKQKLTLLNLYKLSSLFNMSFTDFLPDISDFLAKDPSSINRDELLEKTKAVRKKFEAMK